MWTSPVGMRGKVDGFRQEVDNSLKSCWTGSRARHNDKFLEVYFSSDTSLFLFGLGLMWSFACLES
ncbi:hypothetical protein DL98DRAFT_307498 [Cadophora sp. DSE1049]|nr:hypothetical protein DL98DRAFT_307498 [Cadophora sp. DSE1049]